MKQKEIEAVIRDAVSATLYAYWTAWPLTPGERISALILADQEVTTLAAEVGRPKQEIDQLIADAAAAWPHGGVGFKIKKAVEEIIAKNEKTP